MRREPRTLSRRPSAALPPPPHLILQLSVDDPDAAKKSAVRAFLDE